MDVSAESPVASAPRRRWWFRGLFLALVLLIGVRSWYVFAGPNVHSVVPGKVYRSAQPDGPGLESLLRDYRIRTVVNLRGYCPEFDWYRDEQMAIHAADGNLEDITLSAKALPPPSELRRLIDVLDRGEYPMLIHCKQGADRTGLVSAIVLLLYSDATLRRARAELYPLRGHVAVGATAAMDEFLDRYEAWLAAEGVPHSADRFRHWILNVYQPGVGRSEMHLVNDIYKTVKTGQPLSIVVRAWNRSADPWEFKPGSRAGINLGYRLARDGVDVFQSRAGLFRRTVRPGEFIDLNVALPPLSPGNYILHMQLFDYRGAGIDQRVVPFSKSGDAPFNVGFTLY